MQIGNWVPIDKRMKKFLPKTRKFTELEAVFSLTIDYDNQNEVTISGYSKLWGWSRTKVKTFFDQLGIEVIYSDDTKSVQKQKGQIKKQKEDREETEKRHLRFIDSKWLKEAKNSKKTVKKQKEDRSKSTTIDPSLNPNPEPIIKDTIKPENVSDQTWNDFLTHRKSKKAPVTQTVINTFSKEAELAGMSLEEAFIESSSRGWTGFKAEWVKNKTQQIGKPSFQTNPSLKEIFKKKQEEQNSIININPDKKLINGTS